MTDPELQYKHRRQTGGVLRWHCLFLYCAVWLLFCWRVGRDTASWCVGLNLRLAKDCVHLREEHTPASMHIYEQDVEIGRLRKGIPDIGLDDPEKDLRNMVSKARPSNHLKQSPG